MALDHPAGCVVNYDSFDYNTGEGAQHSRSSDVPSAQAMEMFRELTTRPHTGLRYFVQALKL